MRTPMRLMVLWLTLAAIGCGDDHAAAPHDDDGNHHDDSGDGCGRVENCMDTVDLEEGLAVEGEDGKFTLTVDMHNTLAPKDSQWGVTLADAAGDPVANAKLTVDVWSVDCGHGGPLPADEITTDADGKATLQPVAAHGGPWDVIVKVKAGSVSDTITVNLCIPGADHPAEEPHAEEDAGG